MATKRNFTMQMHIMTPQEILKHLGFDVPDEGVRINPADAFLTAESLRLLGATLDVERVTDADLAALRSGIVKEWSTAGNVAPPEQAAEQGNLTLLRSTVRLL